MKKETPARVAIYCRVSSAEQEKEGTIETQHYTLQDLIRQRFGDNFVVVKVYEDDGWTGTNTEDIIYDVNANQSITIKEGNGVLTSDDIQTNTLLSLYPNPSNDGVFKLSVNNNKSNTLKVYDLAGRLIFKIKNLKDKDEFSLNHCKKGIYLAKVSSGQKSSIIKLVLN